MRGTLALLLAVTFTAVFPAAAQISGAGAPCGAETSSDGGCCGNLPAALDCYVAGCAGSGAPIVLASPGWGLALRNTDSPEALLAHPVAPPARAPDTAPPKPAV